jgi:hypothetical protein
MSEDPMVHHPDHYTSGGYEVLDVIRAKIGTMSINPYVAYCLGNVLKYTMRCAYKGKMLQDLEKAAFYLNDAIQYLKNESDG